MRLHLKSILLAFVIGLGLLSHNSFAQLISAGGNQSLAVCNSHLANAWGYNYQGQVGNGTSQNSIIPPTQISGLNDVIAVAGGDVHSLALKADGTVWAWGDNTLGQLGNGTLVSSNVPLQVNLIGPAIAIEGGGDHSMALLEDGTVWTWGYNSNGQLGNGSIAFISLTPVQATGLTGVIAISGGYLHSLALKNDGTVWAWGRNSEGQLGTGNTVESNVPVQVIGLSGIVSIAGAPYHSLAVKNDGTAWAWGYNSTGQLGIGNISEIITPMQMIGISGVVAAAGGDLHSMVLKNDGHVWATGNNYFGQLGIGNTMNSNVLMQVSGLKDVTSISCGWIHSLAVRNDNSVWTWGDNTYGQLGMDSITYSNLPLELSGVCRILTGIKEPKEQKDGSIFPNPFSTNTTLNFERNVKSGTLIIFNTQGQLVKQIPAISGETFNLERENTFDSGVYIIQLMEENTITFKKKLLISDN